MGKQVKTNYACPICKEKTEVALVKPSYFRPSAIFVNCLSCEATFRAIYTLEKGGALMKVDSELKEITDKTRKVLETHVAEQEMQRAALEKAINEKTGKDIKVILEEKVVESP